MAMPMGLYKKGACPMPDSHIHTFQNSDVKRKKNLLN